MYEIREGKVLSRMATTVDSLVLVSPRGLQHIVGVQWNPPSLCGHLWDPVACPV